MSDNALYPAFCYGASQDESLFKSFKRNPIYMQILEHVTKQQGQEYLDVMAENPNVIFSDTDWVSFIKNDMYGNPKVFRYVLNDRTLFLSPTTIRYAKVLQDVVALFDTEGITSIAEIGVGYGGQCRIAIDYLPGVKEYTLYDLPEVLLLAEKFLGKFGEAILDRVSFVDALNIQKTQQDKRYDFCISNYAFSELARAIQDIYLEQVVLCSDAGYITWNSLSCRMLNGYSVEDLLEKIPGSSVVEERPLTSSENCVIVWGNK